MTYRPNRSDRSIPEKSRYQRPLIKQSAGRFNPASGEALPSVENSSTEYIQNCVLRAQNALYDFSRTTFGERRQLVERIKSGLIARSTELAETITTEMGAPISLSKTTHVQQAIDHIVAAEEVSDSFTFSYTHQSGYRIYLEPIGVCGLITPWNWPLIQVVCKVIPALLTGCCALLKASEVTHRTSQIFAEVVDEAGVPPGIFSLISGVGETVGRMIVQHPGIAMISFTGSTAAGADVARRAANTVKRVVQELGGKSAYIVAVDFRRELTR